VPAIETHDLRKRYRGVEALRGVSIAVAPGEVYGLLGPNGAGRDHHPGGFTAWRAGDGVKPGFAFGATDEFGHLVDSP
jgi:hypothetical protein